MTLVKHGKLARSNPDLQLEDLYLTSSIEAMTHWVSSASFLHVEIFLKGLFQDWKGLTTHLSFVCSQCCRFLDEQMRRSFTNSNYTESYYCSFPFFKYTLKNIKHKITFKPMWKCFCWRSVECNNTITIGPELLQRKLPLLVQTVALPRSSLRGWGRYSEGQRSVLGVAITVVVILAL